MVQDRTHKPYSSSVASGTIWLAGGRVLIRGIGLISTLMLARLLIPEDFGLVALASAVVFVLETLSDLRFEHAIIAQRDTADSDLNTAWTLNMLRGVTLALLLAALAYPYASLMGDQRLVALLLVLTLAPLIDGLRNPGFITFEKSMVFHKEFTLQVAHKVLTFAVTVSLAWITRSYWALVAGMLTGAAVRVAASYLMHPYRPRPALSSWRRLVGFSGWLMGSNLVTALLHKVEFFLIGAFLPIRTVGLFHVGSEIARMASNEMVLPAKRALFPALTAMGDDPVRQFSNFCRALEVVSAIALPMGIGLALVAEPFVLVALGERWQETTGVIRYIAPVGAIWAIAGMCDVLTMARRETRRIFWRELVKASFLIPAYSLGVWMDGLAGLLNASVIVAILVLLLNLDMVRRQSQQPLLRPLRGTWRSLIACLAMALCLTWLGAQPLPVDDLTALVGRLLWLIAAGASSYLAIHLLLWQLAGRPDGIERLAVDYINRYRSNRAS